MKFLLKTKLHQIVLIHVVISQKGKQLVKKLKFFFLFIFTQIIIFFFFGSNFLFLNSSKKIFCRHKTPCFNLNYYFCFYLSSGPESKSNLSYKIIFINLWIRVALLSTQVYKNICPVNMRARILAVNWGQLNIKIQGKVFDFDLSW